jgi:hypothetical protein
MAGYFKPEQLADFHRGRGEVARQFAELRERFIVRKYRNERAREYATNGFGRRLGTLVLAIDQVYKILPPEREDIPERDEVVEATMAIQAFVLNTFGCLDNLAWIWVFEKNVKGKAGKELDRRQVGMGSELVRKSFRPEFVEYLNERKDWFGNLKDFRDSLVHRIPLYIPPYIVTPDAADEWNRLERESMEAVQRGDYAEYDRLQVEQKKLGKFRPWMTHSLFEQSPSIVFHSQLLADYVTVDEFGRTMLEQLDR